MFREISMKSIRRSPVKSGLLLLLMILVTVFLILGASMLDNSTKLLKQADQNYTTVGMLEYTGGSYPDETNISKKTQKLLMEFPMDQIQNQSQVLEFQQMYLMLGYLPGADLNNYFQLPFYNNSVIRFRVLYATEEGTYQCVLVDSIYSEEDKPGTIFGLSKEASQNVENIKLEADHTYVGHGDFRKEDNLLVFCPISSFTMTGENNPASKIKDFPVVDITDQSDYLESSEDMTYWNQIADFYSTQNGSLKVIATAQLEYQRDFFLGSNTILDGRSWTAKEEEDGEKVCLISKAMATNMEKTVGDSIEIDLHYAMDQTDFYNSYDPQTGFREKSTYRIIGIYRNSQNYSYEYIFLPTGSVTNLPQNQVHYDFGTVVLKNGTEEEYLENVKSVIGNHFKLSIYDQGYQETVNPIYAMRRNAILILVLCGMCAASVIWLFAILFILKQQETVAIMTALGTGRKNIRKYLLTGAAALTGTGCLAGLFIAYFSAGKVVESAYQMAVKSQKKDLRFSSITMGTQRAFEWSISSSLFLAIVLALVVFLVTMLVCAYETEHVITLTANFGGQIRRKKKPVKVVEAAQAPKMSFQFQEIKNSKRHYYKRKKALFTIGHSVRNIKRNARVSSVLFIVAVAIGMFMIFYTRTISNYKEDLQNAYEEFPVDAYFTTPSGRPIKSYNIQQDILDYMEKCRNIQYVYKSSNSKYEYLGKLDEKESQLETYSEKMKEELVTPGSSFGWESLFSRFDQDNDLIMTNEISRTKEFFQETPPNVTYLMGYEDLFDTKDAGNFLASEQETDTSKGYLTVLVNESFLSEKNLNLGDTIAIELITYNEQDNYFHHETVRAKIVGSYPSADGLDTLYEPWNSEMDTGLVDYENYRLQRTQELSNLRDNLQKMGVGAIGEFGDARVSFVIEDKALIQSVNNIQNNISFLQRLEYILFLLIFMIGFVVSYLTMRTRKSEIAVIRSLGTGTVRTFIMLFTEQLLIGLIGIACSIGISAVILQGIWVTEIQMVFAFYLFFILGSGICIGRMNQSNVLGILSAAE